MKEKCILLFGGRSANSGYGGGSSTGGNKGPTGPPGSLNQSTQVNSS